jgi:hypothetical protein
MYFASGFDRADAFVADKAQPRGLIHKPKNKDRVVCFEPSQL